METTPHGAWYAALDPRQKATIDHALSYMYNYAHAGVPGHSAHLLIAKLVELLDDCWRDPEPGVKAADHVD